jgi:hypothetical protein
MTHKPTRQEMINALTHYEFQWLIDNPDYLSQVTEFFSNGGFNNYTDESLTVHYERTIVEGVAE